MVYKIRYTHRVYAGCDEATEMSKNWERIKTGKLCWGFLSIWGIICGALSVYEIITGSYSDGFVFSLVVFLAALAMDYFLVFRSRYVYPTCEELVLASQRNEHNMYAIDAEILVIKERKKKSINKALWIFSALYLTVLGIIVGFLLIRTV